MSELKNCHDCGVKPGEQHVHGCDAELCPLCQCQLIGCGCIYEVNELDVDELKTTHPEIYMRGPTSEMYKIFDKKVEEHGGYLPWPGEPPGTKECRELGWYVRSVEDEDGNFVRWERCSPGDPGAMEDLTRWISAGRIKPSDSGPSEPSLLDFCPRPTSWMISIDSIDRVSHG